MSAQSKKLKATKEIAVFSMLGALMFCSKIIMEALPNIHLIGMLTMVCTVVFRKKALIPLYLFVILNGIFSGFDIWWWPYTYIWTVLWGVTMLIPKNLSERAKRVVYPAVCMLHGLLYGTLYAPFQALAFGLDFKGTIAWIIAGLPFDAIHAAGNFALGLFILPLSDLLKKITADIE
ncbi:MAG: hypothetical protein MJ080_01420 [Clostridia bacterium]|nr:hypothetical protein [Clostridia bacterium]